MLYGFIFFTSQPMYICCTWKNDHSWSNIKKHLWKNWRVISFTLYLIKRIQKVHGNVTRGRFSLLSSFYMIHKVQRNVTRGRFSLLSSFYMIHKVHGNVTRGRFSLLSSFYMIHKVQGNVTRGRFSLLSSFYMNHKVQREVTRGRFSLLSSFYIIHKMMPWSPKFAYFCNFRTFICVFNVSSGMSLLSVGLGGNRNYWPRPSY